MRMTGVILPDDNVENPVPIPEPYWNAAGGMYAYIVGQLSLLGIDVLGQSQLVGYPTQVTKLFLQFFMRALVPECVRSAVE
jgi:hypothetical protein